jgi:hypothetical protein
MKSRRVVSCGALMPAKSYHSLSVRSPSSSEISGQVGCEGGQQDKIVQDTPGAWDAW